MSILVLYIADLSESETQDRELLVRAACAVVLQREVSLSRRVYTWLLGKDESPEQQMAYFRTYGLELLFKVLKVRRTHIGGIINIDGTGRYGQSWTRVSFYRCSETVQGVLVVVG